MMSSDEFAYANQVRTALEERAPRTAWLILLILFLLIAAALVWARWAVVEEVTTGHGRVIPSTQNQIVQTLEGGIVSAIEISEGDLVEEGQVIMRIDDTGFASRLGELRQRRWALLAEILRREAEASGAAELPDHGDLMREAPRVYATESELFSARSAKHEDDLNILRQQKIQRQREFEELQARETRLANARVPLQRELELTRSMYESGVVPEIEFLRLQRQAVEMDGDLTVMRASIETAAAGVVEAQGRITNAGTTFRSEARERLATARAELAIIDESIKAARDRVLRTALLAPVRGVVNTLTVTTIGAVTQPGQAVAEIVPLDDTLLIEARIRPQDVAFIHPGQQASVKLTAYDYSIYGALDGEVERIGADTVTDETGESYYQVVIRTHEHALTGREGALPIIPGMVATVDILTGDKTVFDYLAKPVLRVRDEALRER